jgi:hypothetical protein
MSNADGIRMTVGCPFFYLAKYEGERSPRPEATGDRIADDLESLQADLTDPACTRLVTGGDGVPTQYWRKCNGPDE